MFLAEFAQGVREGLEETLGTMNRSRMIMLAIIVAIGSLRYRVSSLLFA